MLLLTFGFSGCFFLKFCFLLLNYNSAFLFFFLTSGDGVIGFLYFDFQLGPLLDSPAVFRLSYIRLLAHTTLKFQELRLEIDRCKVGSR